MCSSLLLNGRKSTLHIQGYGVLNIRAICLLELDFGSGADNSLLPQRER